MNLRFFLISLLIFSHFSLRSFADQPFFQANVKQPYHLSVGAVLFDDKGQIACHHFSEILGQKDVYILMRESMENDETLLQTLHRGLKEEFGAEAKPIAFLGSLTGFLYDPVLPFDKTTLYIACELAQWIPSQRNLDDIEATSLIEWLDPNQLIVIMQRQGERFKRVDADESCMIQRALPYIQQCLEKNRAG